MNTYRTITNLRGEVETLTAERDALQAALTTEREIWLNAASEQDRVIAELREAVRELCEVVRDEREAERGWGTSLTAWQDAKGHTDAIVARHAAAPEAP